MKVPGLTIRELADGHVLVLAIDPEVAREERDMAMEAALCAIRRGTRFIIVDFSRTKRISSSIPGLLAFYSKNLQKQGRELLAVKGPAYIMSLLKVTGVDRVVPFFDTLSEALDRAGFPATWEEPEPA